MKQQIEDYRPIPFWAWNGEITEEKIKKHIQKLKDGGFGGAFIHPRPGLTVPYLSEEWFKLWKSALEEAKRLKLKLYIYDENTYPTGYAGGYIMSQYPDCAARSVKVKIFKNGECLADYQKCYELPEEIRSPLKVYEVYRIGNDIQIFRDLTEEENEERWSSEKELAVLIYQMPYFNSWFGGFPNTDLLRPEVTKAFLDFTHEQYFEHFKDDFGRWIPAIFSDEPGISPGSVNLEDPMAFPYSPYLSYEFYEKYGYSLEDNMIKICFNVENSQGITDKKVRYDYYSLLRDLWIKNFAKPVHEWCKDHGIAWTGHFLDEHWPYPWGCASPSVMSMYEWMDWPGIDMLMTHMLKEDGTTPMLISVKELQSIGEQLGKERLLCECFGAGGWDASILDFKRIGDWLAAHGINFFNPHLILDSIQGVRKYGHPQSFDWREPWWKESKRLMGYFTRLSEIIANGKRQVEILIMHPTTTWFLKTPSESAGNILWDYEKMDEDFPVKTYIKKLQKWSREGIEFDFGDEYILEKYGKVERGKLCIGQAEYSEVYIPKEMKNVRLSTKHLLEEAKHQGVKVWMESNNIHYIEGTYQKDNVFAFPVCSEEKFVQYIKQRGRVTGNFDGKGIFASKLLMKNARECIFIVNSSPELRSAVVQLKGKSVNQIDLFTGKRKPFPFVKKNGYCEMKVTLGSEESIFLESSMQNRPIMYEKKRKESNEILLHPVSVEREKWNVLMLDYGNLFIRNKWSKDIHVLAACEKIYQAHGFEKNPWDMAIQYRDRIISKNKFKMESGFLFEYPFQIKNYKGNLYVAIEHPQFCEIFCNGLLLKQCTDKIWIDEELGIFEIPETILKENNILAVQCCPFDVQMELQPVYILGEFSLRESEKGFVIDEFSPLTIGNLCSQGLYFYQGRINYKFSYIWKGNKELVELYMGEYEASALTIYINRKWVGQSGTEEGRGFNIMPYLKEGENEIRIELSCSLKNLFGPHHTPCKIRNSAWPNAWKMAPIYGQPAGKKYDCIAYGLKEAIVIKNGSKE